MFALEVQAGPGWRKLNDYFIPQWEAVSAARRLMQKEKRTFRVVVFPRDEATDLGVIETFHYVPPAPRDVTALTKEIFG